MKISKNIITLLFLFSVFTFSLYFKDFTLPWRIFEPNKSEKKPLKSEILSGLRDEQIYTWKVTDSFEARKIETTSRKHPECSYDADNNVIIGELSLNKSYAVFSTTSNTRNALSFTFYLPLTALAWQRIGFGSVVVVVGACEDWFRDLLFNHVLQQLRSLDAVVVFLPESQLNDLMISQVSRLFVANILLKKFAAASGVYLVTSDSDIWPLSKEVYELTAGKSILSLNSECCPPFRHKGKVYKMLPLSNIGMSLAMWARVMSKFNMFPCKSEEMVLYMLKEFGGVAARSVKKGENAGWYMDQLSVSMAIARLHQRNRSIIKYTARNTNLDRIDKNGLRGRLEIEDKIDIHLPDMGFRIENFSKIKRILKLMYSEKPDSFNFCMQYHLAFKDLISP